MTHTIGFLGGGQMGEALIRGMLSSGLYKASHIIVADPDESRRVHMNATHGVTVSPDAKKVWREAAVGRTRLAA